MLAGRNLQKAPFDVRATVAKSLLAEQAVTNKYKKATSNHRLFELLTCSPIEIAFEKES